MVTGLLSLWKKKKEQISWKWKQISHITHIHFDIEIILHFLKEELQGWYTNVVAVEKHNQQQLSTAGDNNPPISTV